MDNDKNNLDWIGIEWDEDDSGLYDGSVFGKRYFNTKENKGSFIDLQNFQEKYIILNKIENKDNKDSKKTNFFQNIKQKINIDDKNILNIFDNKKKNNSTIETNNNNNYNSNNNINNKINDEFQDIDINKVEKKEKKIVNNDKINNNDEFVDLDFNSNNSNNNIKKKNKFGDDDFSSLF
jgi:hypothetical protein